jgi:hypothetical protein
MTDDSRQEQESFVNEGARPASLGSDEDRLKAATEWLALGQVDLAHPEFTSLPPAEQVARVLVVRMREVELPMLQAIATLHQQQTNLIQEYETRLQGYEIAISRIRGLLPPELGRS